MTLQLLCQIRRSTTKLIYLLIFHCLWLSCSRQWWCAGYLRDSIFIFKTQNSTVLNWIFKILFQTIL